MSGKTVTFIGHNDCFKLNYACLTKELEKIIKEGYYCFINEGMGQFDWTCARAVYTLKKRYPYLKNCLVIPYLSFTIRETSYFDEILYPEGLENYFFPQAILKRNQYLVDQSNVAVCYINHPWGGAIKTYNQAVKKGLRIINLGTLT